MDTTDWDELQVVCNQIMDASRNFEGQAATTKKLWRNRRKWLPWFKASCISKFAARINSGDLSSHGRIFSVYKPLGKPVGLMHWERTDSMGAVRQLAMLPGHESEGAILVEHAVNLSEKAGYEGRVFFPIFHDSFGYKPSWAQCLQSGTVVPSDSSAWVKLGEEWHLMEHLSKDLNWRRVTLWREIGRETF